MTGRKTPIISLARVKRTGGDGLNKLLYSFKKITPKRSLCPAELPLSVSQPSVEEEKTKTICMKYLDAEEYLDFGSILERDCLRKCHTKLESHGKESLNEEPECPNDQTKQNPKKWEDLSMILSGAYFDGSDIELELPCPHSEVFTASYACLKVLLKDETRCGLYYL